MYIINTQSKNIVLTSFEGFSFTIPPGVSWIWDKAGEHLVKNIYHIESKTGTDKYGNDNGHGVPPLLYSTEDAWIKDGKKLCQVERFKINEKLIPRAKMITVAKQRGVKDDKIMEYLSDPNIDASAIAQEINQLPVPEMVKLPMELAVA